MQKYTFPTPPPVPVLSPVEEEAESAAFRAHIEEIAAKGGGVVTIPKEAESRLTTSVLSAFWDAVSDRLPDGWTLEESGLADLFCTRFLRPVKPVGPSDAVQRALAVVDAYVPCEHGAWEALGTGEEWAKCQDCGTQFRLRNHHRHREATGRFLRAMDVLRAACT